MKIVDTHIHLDYYKTHEIAQIMDWHALEAMISVSSNLDSCKQNLFLSSKYKKVKPAFGFHPEQDLPTEKELGQLLAWMEKESNNMVAVGEVGLPYYLRKDQKVTKKQYEQYIEMLESFIKLAKKWDKPIILHAVYEDAPIVCDLLEKYTIWNAQFHWFKGDFKTLERMEENGYIISVTPEVVYRERIQEIVQSYPMKQIMVETDGPWPFDGPFSGKRTNPRMLKHSIASIAKLKKLSEIEVSETILKNSKAFFRIE